MGLMVPVSNCMTERENAGHTVMNKGCCYQSYYFYHFFSEITFTQYLEDLR